LASYNDPNYVGSGFGTGLVVDNAGNLFGYTTLSGQWNHGSIFEVPNGSGAIVTVASLDSSPPSPGYGSPLVMDSNGNLFGVTSGSGVGGDLGLIFELAHGATTISKLASFTNANGAFPNAGLTIDSAGNLYGTTAYGGSLGQGTVFELPFGSNTISVLASFDQTSGVAPGSALTIDNAGNLYGTGGGTIFELPQGSHIIRPLATGATVNPLIVDGNGNLFGTTKDSVFELTKGSNTITILASFDGPNGFEPAGGLTEDSNGNLYGTTYGGGPGYFSSPDITSSGYGTLFELVHGNSTITPLAFFYDGSNNLAFPWSGVIRDNNGNLYGTTSRGGLFGGGAVFEWQAPAPAPTATTVISNVPSGSVYGQTVTFTATITPTSGSGTPTGSIQFSIDGSNFGTPLTLSSGSASISTAALTAGTHTISATYSGDSNFQGGTVTLNGGQVVSPAPLVISANNQTMIYGSSVPALTASYSGFVNGETSAILTTLPTLSTTATSSSQVLRSPYSITVSGATDPNYTISYVPGTLTITPAALTITADNKTKVYGDPLPTLTASYSGFVNGDTASNLTTLPTLSTAATPSSLPGTYPITASGAADPNYIIAYVPGTLTVTPPAIGIIGRVQQSGQWWVGASNGSAFSSTQPLIWSTGVTWVDVLTGDFNGDGFTDIAGRAKETGDWWVSLANGSGGFTTSKWDTWRTDITWVDVKVGRFSTDVRDEIVGRALQTGQWWVAQSTGSSFNNSLWATWSTGATWVDVQVGHFYGSTRTDIAGRWLQGGQWWVGQSTGGGFSTGLWATWSTAVTWVDVQVGDLNGHGRSDIIGRAAELGQWWAGISDGSSFASSQWDVWSTGVTWVDVHLADFNGDGKMDIVGRAKELGQWWVGLSNGSGFATTLWSTWSTGVTWVDAQIGDFNGDGKADITGRALELGAWYTGLSNGSTAFATSLWATWSTAVTWVDVRHGNFI
jgi:uncharacterized repeat protein (TIGR03803 family)